MEAVFRYVLLALAAVIPFWIITPESVGGWLLWIAIALVAASAVQGALTRFSK